MKLTMMLKSFLSALLLLLVAPFPLAVVASPLGYSPRIIGGSQVAPGDYPYYGKFIPIHRHSSALTLETCSKNANPM